jgi:hypothetical protein
MDARLRRAARRATTSSSGESVFGGALTFFNPEFFGTPLEGTFPESWEYVFYLGAIPSLLALVGATKGWRRPLVRVLLIGVVVSLALAVTTPLLRLVYELVPGYGLFRLPARVLFVAAFLSFCLAGVGFDEILAAARPRRSRSIVAAVLIGLVAVEGVFWARRYLQNPNPIPLAVDAAYLHAIDRGNRVARVAPMSRSTPSYGSAAALGLELVTGYDPFNMRHYQTYMDLLRYGRTLGRRPV